MPAAFCFHTASARVATGLWCAARSFLRYAYRAGCNASRQAGGPWHAQFNAREQHSESARHMQYGWYNWGDFLKDAAGVFMGDKLAVRPLLVDDF